MIFRDNLRETLDFLGMEQKELAAKTGLSLKTIENYVKKDSSLPAVDKAVLIAQALGVTVEYLVNGKKTKKETPPTIPSQHKEVLDIVSKLNKTNHEVITTVAKTLLNLQTKSKLPSKE
ncbi:MAG: helix-turn-helix domain-containing protein [Treponema sp.]|jgi:transcriptional regulator with XRE-family HTH domain|nr:helix-turn-helix domain-containing protein [Treponema sp.]